MKSTPSISLILLIMIMHPSCRQKEAFSPLEFKAYEHNPILVPGEPGSWDELIIVAPNVILHDKVFYLFYTAFFQAGGGAIGLATSSDGYHFMKYPGNPILSADKSGFDAFGTGGSVVIKTDTTWLMYFGASELPIWGAGQDIGIATSRMVTGPWKKNESPVLRAGSKGEWDAGFIFPSSVIINPEGILIMYYTANREQLPAPGCYIGMATSEDGIHWKKYNDPSTTGHPFAESDPVLKPGMGKEWDNRSVWSCSVFKGEDGFEMYYGGDQMIDGIEKMAFGLAHSKNGINWEKHNINPIYNALNDVYHENFCECPSICFTDSLCYLYYDYGSIEGKIGVATAKIQKTKYQRRGIFP
jgi:predicted GH43/DUF377 family glycosyl hydrolase